MRMFIFSMIVLLLICWILFGCGRSSPYSNDSTAFTNTIQASNYTGSTVTIWNDVFYNDYFFVSITNPADTSNYVLNGDITKKIGYITFEDGSSYWIGKTAKITVVWYN